MKSSKPPESTQGMPLFFQQKTYRQLKNRVRHNEPRSRKIYIQLLLSSGLILAVLLQPDLAPAQSTQAVSKQAAQSTEQSAVFSQQIKELIAGLADFDHNVRSQSEASLLKIGEPAVKHLKAVLNFEDADLVPDNEVRLRSKRLLILIQRQVRERELAEFLDGQRDEIQLAGWSDFREAVGNKRPARRLFIKLHDSRPSLFAATKLGKDETQTELHKIINSRIRLSGNGNAASVVGNLGAVLFAASRKTKWAPNQSASAPNVVTSDTKRIHGVLVQPHMVTTLESQDTNAEFKILISNWIDSLQFQSEDSAKNAIASIEVIDAYQMSNKSDLTLSFALDKKRTANIRSSAIKVLSRVGDAKALPKLAPLLTDKTVVGNYLLDRAGNTADQNPGNERSRPLLEVQIRDLALAATIVLSEKSPLEFGFYPQSHDEEGLVINQAGFLSEQERSKAFSQWQAHSSDEKGN